MQHFLYFREGNLPADSLANWSIIHKTTRRFTHAHDLPLVAKGALKIDKWGWPYLRKMNEEE